MTTEALLEMHKAFNKAVVPIKRGHKRPDPTMSRRQRGTTAWKQGSDSYYNRPATSDEVREWDAAGLGIGMIAGRSDAVALEIDAPDLFMPMLEGLSGIRTATSKTRRGYHLFFKAAPGISNQDISCPVFNDKNSPCYCGVSHLASVRADSEVTVLPPAENREWLLHPKDVGLAEMPAGLLGLCEFFKEITKQRKSAPRPGGKQQPDVVTTPVEGAVLLDYDVCDEVLNLIKAPDSPLIPAIVRDLGGQGLKVRCPYHPPDDDPSATLWLGRSGWTLLDHHSSPPEHVMLSQLSADRLTGYLDRLTAGEANQYRHLVSRQKGPLRKVKREGFVWLALLAEEVGVVALPPSKLPDKLEGFSPDGLRMMCFIERWDQGYRGVFGSEVFPLARRWLISVVFATDPYDEKSAAWKLAYNEVDKILLLAIGQELVERVALGKVGFGGTATLYRLLG